VIHRQQVRPAPYVTLNLKNAPVRSALLQLFQKAHRDYSLSNDVDGIVTLRLTNRPFNEALRILATNASVPLTYNLDSGVYFIRPSIVRAVREPQTMVAENTTAPVDSSYLPENPERIAEGQEALSPSPRAVTNPFGFGNNGFGYYGVSPVPTFPSYPVPLGTPFTYGGGWPTFGSPTFYGGPLGTAMTLFNPPVVYIPSGGFVGSP